MKKVLLIAFNILGLISSANDMINFEMEHSGRTDYNGCHYARYTGIYHCH